MSAPQATNVGSTAPVGSYSTLSTITNSQSVPTTAPTTAAEPTRLKGVQYDKIYAKNSSTSSSTSGDVPSEKAAAKSGGGDDFFSGIGRALTSAVQVAMAVVNPLSAVASTADTIGKALNKKA